MSDVGHSAHDDDAGRRRSAPPVDPWRNDVDVSDRPTTIASGEQPTGVEQPTSVDQPLGASASGTPSATPIWTSPWEPPTASVAPGSEGDNRRLLQLLIALVALVIVLLVVAVALLYQGDLGRGSANPAVTSSAATDPSRAPGAQSAPRTAAAPAPTTSASSSGAPRLGGTASSVAVDSNLVVYEITASGSSNLGEVSYTDADGTIIRRRGIALPWKLTFRPTGRRQSFILNAQRLGGPSTGPVGCTITYGGKLLSSDVATGRFAAVSCTG